MGASEFKNEGKAGVWANRFWGRMAPYDGKTRAVALALILSSLAALLFTHLGYLDIGIIDGHSVYILFLLCPLVVGAMVFGPLTGALIGLYAGAMAFFHASVLPFDFYEVYFMTPLNTFCLLTFIGAASGVLFKGMQRFNLQGGKWYAFLAGVCIVVSFVASVLVQVNTVIYYGGMGYIDVIRTYLLNSTAGVVVQALIDAALLMFLCWIAEVIVRKVAASGSSRRLLAVFREWMLLVSLIVFMLASALIYSSATLQAQGNAGKAMYGEVTYLQNQLATREIPDLDTLIDGYEVPIDGVVVITDEQGTILATDDEDRYPVGASFAMLLTGADYLSDGVYAGEYLESIVAEGNEASILQAVDENGVATMDEVYLSIGPYDGGYVAMLRTPGMVFEGRQGVMVATTLLAVLLILSIALLASRLLNQVVVRRIDETNDTLGKITDGDLNERVHVRDSREFASLSAGINTTVAALKESIAEAEQRNARELMTAKAIQESSLPREFPPFPDIDRFDIYASMKTAKEVGGDFYDFFLIDESRLGFLIADVSGKGIPAALFMMTAKTQIQNYMEAGLPVEEAVGAANHQLCIGNDANMFVTAFVCILDFKTGALSFANAGHNPPLICHEGSWEWLHEVSGMPLGLFDGLPYTAHSLQLELGDMLYLYTDGVTEAMSTNNELFGEERLEETLRRHVGMNARSTCVGVRCAITDFTHDAEQSDDITVLALKYGVPPERKAVMILPAKTDQLVHLNNFIHEELHRRNAPHSVYNPLDIAAEELFVNVCRYAYPDATPDNPGEARIGFEYESNPPSLTVSITDDGVPYNPLAKPDAVTPDDIGDVPIGGLGILMAKKSVDEMTYERVGESNVLTFRKGW